ncbi:hypothetical protein RHMOL_Rhmol01G0184000 [Rhododendron molle]|uniref:Uncharacterized protein n=1 Tax=Rhododendron molle TaxID=49168 RepID=A0ACC0Q2J4_RHOML|nr:hypothetical protein RHMOL_Rhmol01G0184000 [Rhododendron molle]
MERAVARAKTLLERTRATFISETYIPPAAHLFVPSGIDGYTPSQDSYDDGLVLRDPLFHMSVGWEQV